MDKLTMNPQQFKILKKKYNEAKEKNEKSFYFQDREILVSYASYLIEYLENEYKKSN